MENNIGVKEAKQQSDATKYEKPLEQEVVGVDVEEAKGERKLHFRNTVIVAAVGAGVQFSWALQLSLLTPYVQLLGIPHKWAAFIWLCGPISGMIVQPSVGYYSDRCTSLYGRRRPFIASGAALVIFAVFLIGFAADLGHIFGDSPGVSLKPRAIAVFVLGFWILDVANNMLTGPCRALLADLSGDNHKRMRRANSLFSFFLSIGNILGYAAGSFSRLHTIFPFTNTSACDIYCANLKSCFLIAVVLLVTVVTLCLTLVHEKPYCKTKEEEKRKEEVQEPVYQRILLVLKGIPRPMWILLLVTFLNWMAWFPFFLFDTDWMGREVYGGEVGKGSVYDKGVRAGTLGLMLNSVFLGITSLSVGLLVRGVGSVKRLWGLANFLLAVCMGMTVVVTKIAGANRSFDANGIALPPSAGVKIAALSLFTVLGIPLAVTYSIPFALASIFSNTSGAGQGLSLGVLNLAIVIPQMLVSVTSGPWDALFGGGNLPAFVVGAIAAALSGVVALTILPSPPADSETIDIMTSGGGHP